MIAQKLTRTIAALVFLGASCGVAAAQSGVRTTVILTDPGPPTTLKKPTDTKALPQQKAGFKGGVNVATGDVTGDGLKRNKATPLPKKTGYAYDAGFRGGVAAPKNQNTPVQTKR